MQTIIFGCLKSSLLKITSMSIENILIHILYSFSMKFSRNELLQDNSCVYIINEDLLRLFLKTRRPPTFPCRLQHSIIGRFRLNHRVRDVITGVSRNRITTGNLYMALTPLHRCLSHPLVTQQ